MNSNQYTATVSPRPGCTQVVTIRASNSTEVFAILTGWGYTDIRNIKRVEA